MTDTAELLKDIESFTRATGMTPGYLGLVAVGNGHLVSRLREGGEIRRDTEARLRQFMRLRMADDAWWAKYPHGKWRKGNEFPGRPRIVSD